LEYRDRGYLPEAVFNFLALLGWSPGDDREKMSTGEIVSAFSLDRMSPKGAAFDETKLEWLNGQYIRDLSSGELFARVAPLWRDAGFIQDVEAAVEQDRLLSILGLLRERARRLTDFVEGARYFFEEPLEYEEKGRRKHWKGPDVGDRLKALKDRLEALDAFDEEHLETAVRGLAEERNISAAKLIHPARLAISGRSFGPGLFEMMEVLGKETVVRRLDRAVRILGG